MKLRKAVRYAQHSKLNLFPATSAEGQSRHFERKQAASGLPRSTEITKPLRHVGSGHRNGYRRCLRDYAPGSRNLGSMSGEMPKNFTILPLITKCWLFDFDCYLTNTVGLAQGESDELEQQRRFFDDTKPHS